MIDVRAESIIYQSQIYLRDLVNSLTAAKKLGKALDPDWRKADLIGAYLEALNPRTRLTDEDDITNVNYILYALISLCELNIFPASAPITFQEAPSAILVIEGEQGPAGAIGTLTNGYMLVGNASNEPTEVLISSHITISNTGVATIANGVITNAHVNASAAISYSKLSLTNSIINTDIGSAAGIVYSKLSLTNSIVNADISSSAAIAYSKLSLTGSIVNADVNASAAIAYSKLALTGSILNADINASAAIARTKLASGTANRIVINNGTGVMTDASVITASRALISSASGIPTHSTVTSTTLAFLDATSSVQTQLNNRLAFSSAITPSTGDIIQYTGGAWTRLAVGTVDQILTSDGTNVSWEDPSGTPGPAPGSDTQVIFNDGATFGADSGLTYDKTTDTLTSAKFKANTTVDTGSPDAAFKIDRTLSANAANGHGFKDQTIFTQTTFAYNPFDSIVTLGNGGAQSFDHIVSFQARAGINTSGTVTTWSGITTQPNLAGGGTITSAYGLYSDDGVGTGTITDYYGVYLRDFTAATNKWGIYQLGSTTKNYLEGKLLINSTNRSINSLTPINPQFQVEGTDAATSSPSFVRNSNDTNGPSLYLGKSRGTVVNSSTIVSSGDILGNIYFVGSDGSTLVQGARIHAITASGIGTNDIPTDLILSTSADGSSSPTERVRITYTGTVGIGTNSPSGMLHVKSATNNSVALLVQDDGGNDIIKAEETGGARQTTISPILIVGNARIHSTGTQNTFVGELSGNLTLSGANDNTALGYSSLVGITSGDRNVSIGVGTLNAVTTSQDNTAIGYSAGILVTGARNTLIGSGAGDNITSGTQNLVLGASLDAQSATADNQLTIQNAIFGSANSSTGTSISTGNIGFYTATWGTSAVRTVALGDGTAPTSSPANSIQYYSESAVFKYRDGAGNIITI